MNGMRFRDGVKLLREVYESNFKTQGKLVITEILETDSGDVHEHAFDISS